MSNTTIVIPCYNEAARLDVERFVRFAQSDPPERLLLVNDGSTDATLDVLNDLHDFDSERFDVLNLPENRGKAEAVRQGMLKALERPTAYVGYWDADLATPLEAIADFRDLLEHRPDLEAVFGSRVRLLGRSIERRAVRHYLGRVFATAASWTLGIGVYDTQCGAKLFRANERTRRLFERPFVTNWIFDVEIIARMIQDRRGEGRPAIDQAIYEFPLHQWHDVAGSKVRPRDFLKALWELAAIRWTYWRSAECGVRSAEFGVRSAELGVGSAELESRSSELDAASFSARPERPKQLVER